MAFPVGEKDGCENIDPALQRIEAECDVISAEKAAFERFRTRVSKITPRRKPAATETTTATPQGTVLQQSATHDRPTLARIRRAYRETVMATDHYDAEYGDTYTESLTVEFGRDVAALLDGAGDFSPAIKDQLLTTISNAIDRRRAARANFHRERDALERAREVLDGLWEDVVAIESRPFPECTDDELTLLRDDLVDLGRRCDELVASRQTGELHTRAMRRDVAQRDTAPDYLYASLDVTYPVLHEAAIVSTRLNDLRSEISRWM